MKLKPIQQRDIDAVGIEVKHLFIEDVKTGAVPPATIFCTDSCMNFHATEY
jgi:hypothetical protein